MKRRRPVLEILEVLHKIVDVVASIGAITGSHQAELHATLEQADKPAEAYPAEPEPVNPDVPAGA
jgi:hypothetical protein